MKFIQEFRDFAVRGNVFDMAVGVIIGGAFGKLAGSFVNDLLMPPIGMLAGKMDFSDIKITLQEAVPEGRTETGEVVKAVPEVAIGVGKFITVTIDFLLMALAVFLLVKLMSRIKRSTPPAPPPPPAPTAEERLLTEIRDLLSARR